MDLSQEQMDISVLNDTSVLNGSSVQHNVSLSTNPNDTTFSSAASQRPVAKNHMKVPANYFDLDDILAMNERVPCQVQQDLFKMGYVDQSTDDEHLPKGTKLELPIWFAKEFHSEQVKVLKIDTPKGYDDQFRQIFKADATVIDLKQICTNFYKFGEHLVDLEFAESNEIAAMLENTFEQRIHQVLNYSLNAVSESVNDGISFRKKLDNLESRLYNAGKKELNKYLRWEENQLHKIDTNELIVNMQKRKQAACHVGLYQKPNQ